MSTTPVFKTRIWKTGFGCSATHRGRSPRRQAGIEDRRRADRRAIVSLSRAAIRGRCDCGHGGDRLERMRALAGSCGAQAARQRPGGSRRAAEKLRRGFLALPALAAAQIVQRPAHRRCTPLRLRLEFRAARRRCGSGSPVIRERPLRSRTDCRPGGLPAAHPGRRWSHTACGTRCLQMCSS